MKNRFFITFLIVFLLVSPGPLGLRPAHAMVPLAIVAVGGIIAATGVMVAGAGVYKPPTFAQANAVVDSVTGDINRKVVVARAFADGLSSGLRGFQSQYTLDFAKAADWIKSHTASYPLLSPAIIAATTSTASIPAVGSIVAFDPAHPQSQNWSTGTDGQNIVDAYGGDYASKGSCSAFFAAQCAAGNILRCVDRIQYSTASPYKPTGVSYNVHVNANGICYLSAFSFNTATELLTNDAVNYPPPGIVSPSAFAAAYPNTQAGQDETDKIAADNPAAIKSPPAAISAAQVDEASKQAAAQSAADTAQTAQAAAAADPTNTALQVAAQQAKAAADQAQIAAQSATGQLETTKPDDPPKTDTPPPAGPALDQDLQIDLSPFLGLKDKAMGKFPFSAVASLGSIFSGFTADPVTPSMDMPMPWGLPAAKISLSKWDDFATKWRLLVAMMFHVSCIYAIVRRYA